MKVLKFGGTSLATPAQIEKVLSIVMPQKDEVAAVVISAFAGVTNALFELAEKAAKNNKWQDDFKVLSERHAGQIPSLIKSKKRQTETKKQIEILLGQLEKNLEEVSINRRLTETAHDAILSFGERLSATIISAIFIDRSIDSQYVDAREIIRTEKKAGRARVDFAQTNKLINAAFSKNPKKLKVITGFIAADTSGTTTTLGRSGSDYTAGILAAAIDASSVEIWTDVDGVMSADPNIVPTAFSITEMSYKEALEMSHFGAKVLHSETITPLMRAAIPLIIKNTNNPKHPGTTISSESSHKDLMKVISSVAKVTIVRLTGADMDLVASPASRAFGALEVAEVPILLVTQASSENTLCLVINREDTDRAVDSLSKEFVTEIKHGLVNQIHAEQEYGLIAAVGDGMRSIPGIAGRFFSVLGRGGINIAAIAQGSSERVISAVVAERDLEKAVTYVHGAFFYMENTVHLFIVGTGLIGSTLMRQIHQKSQSLKKERGIDIRVVGVANSRKMLVDHRGILSASWEGELKGRGMKTELKEYVESISRLDLPHSIFVDCTASESLAPFYPQILGHNISIVTPNKKANTQDYKKYQALQQAAHSSRGRYLYETTAGAGLPTISTLRDLQATGDLILLIQGIFSGSLSYIFNNFGTGVSFSSTVADARKKGYTEPDPRDDLNGMDVARKLLILARELGLRFEISDIVVQNLIPQDARSAKTTEEFFKLLKEHDAEFESLAKRAADAGRSLRYVATLDMRGKNPKAYVKLIEVGADNPFYSVKGADNIFAFTTQRYSELPLVIKGPGAGADVTAGGVFADILRIADYFVT